MAISDYKIRLAIKKDVASIYNLVNQLKKTDLESRNFFSKYYTNLENPYLKYWVVTYELKIVGFISVHSSKPLHHNHEVHEIQEFIVDKAHRGKRIGSLVLRNIISQYKQGHLELTSNRSRKKTKLFYENHDFVATHFKFVYKGLCDDSKTQT
jgi:PhnO protein